MAPGVRVLVCACPQRVPRLRRRHSGTKIALETDERRALTWQTDFFFVFLAIDFVAPMADRTLRMK